MNRFVQQSHFELTFQNEWRYHEMLLLGKGIFNNMPQLAPQALHV